MDMRMCMCRNMEGGGGEEGREKKMKMCRGRGIGRVGGRGSGKEMEK